MSDFIAVGKKAEFKDGGMTDKEISGQHICFARAGDTFYAFDDVCTHAHVMLSRGDLEGDEVVCPLHGARFSIKTGQALTPPAVKPVRTYEVKTEGEEVYVKI